MIRSRLLSFLVLSIDKSIVCQKFNVPDDSLLESGISGIRNNLWINYMYVRNAKDDDCFKIYDLHINSIKHYCSDFYPENAIAAWLELKSPEEYKNLSSNKVILVAVKKDEIVGFGLINLDKKSIDSLYLKPRMTGQGIGKLLLTKLEEIAQKNRIETLKLASTLNAIEFYHHMGYRGEMKSIFKLSSGANLDCVEMTKQVSQRNI